MEVDEEEEEDVDDMVVDVVGVVGVVIVVDVDVVAGTTVMVASMGRMGGVVTRC